jgi:alanine racemase
MIKANAYGHGLRSVAMRLDNKVYSFGVASIDEALALRKVNIQNSITLMSGAFEANDILISSYQNFALIFHEDIQINWLNNIALPKPIKVWLKINTGMNRLGFSLDKAKKIYTFLSQHPNVIQPVGIMSHLACADEPIKTLNQEQLVNFRNFTKDLPGPRSLLNSAGIFSFSDDLYDVVRPGIALYGISPFKDNIGVNLDLKPVMTLQTNLIAVSNVKKGSHIGYGGRFICSEDMKIGVIAMGYGDGYPSEALDGTPILVNNVRCQIVGRVSMDMATIDLRNYPKAKVGDSVILWGDDLRLEEISQYTNLTPYSIISGIQHRVKFQWI